MTLRPTQSEEHNPPEFVTLIGKKEIEKLIATERAAAVRDFGEKVKAVMDTYDYQIEPEAWKALHEEIDQLIQEADL